MEEEKEIERYDLYEKENDRILRKKARICNIDIDKCYEKIYSEDVKDIKDIPKAVRWGAILKATSIEELSYILSDDMLTIEEKERFLNTVREVNQDENILREWEEKYKNNQ